MITLFLLTLAAGMLLALSTLSMDEIAWRFVRIVGIVAWTLSACVVILKVRSQSAWAVDAASVSSGLALAHMLCAALAVFLCPNLSRTKRVVRILAALGGICGMIGVAIMAAAGAKASGRSVDIRALTVVAQCASAFLLGSITVAWLLGHAYLTATKMTIRPLRQMSRVLSWAIALRTLVALGSFGAIAWLSGTDQNWMLHFIRSAWIIVSVRVIIGLVCVAIFAYMVSDCVRLRSTQSATGILYFGSVFAYAGELASQQITQQYGLVL